MSEARSGERRATLAHCRDPGFTPGARDVTALVELWTRTRQPAPPKEGSGEGVDARANARESAQLVVKALARGDRGVARALLNGWAEADGEQRAMRLRVLSRISQRVELPDLPDLLDRALDDPEPRVVREAARAIGRLSANAPSRPDPSRPDPSRYEDALLRVGERAPLPEQRAAVDALGQVGGPRALERLRGLHTDDRDLARRTAEAITLITRRHDREHTSQIELDRPLPPLPVPLRVRLRCRRGVATVVADQLSMLGSRSPTGAPAPVISQQDPTGVELPWSRSLGELYRVRSALEIALVFPLPAAAELLDRIVEGLRQPALVDALTAWTQGPPRFRLTFAAGGRRRALVWQLARTLRERSSPLVNDTRQITWTIEIDEGHDRILCLPRGADPRFTYRRADVPAATHPTFAALMAWAGRPRAGELVWDPFCGSGTELVECAMLTRGLHLRGTDIDAHAITAARQNLAAAALDVASTELRQASALAVTPSYGKTRVSLILANPPMGRRVMVEGRGMRRLLDDFVAHAAGVLAPGGRMIWLSPAPRATASAGRRTGLEPEDLEPIDMGGFWATPQLLRKPR
ncbi:MAG: methyltransferase [Myxococcota bacterium]